MVSAEKNSDYRYTPSGCIQFSFHRQELLNQQSEKKAPCVIFNVLVVSDKQKPCRPEQSHKRAFQTLSVPWYTLPVVKISDSI